MGLTVNTSSSNSHPKNALITDQCVLIVRRSQSRLLHGVNHSRDLALGDHVWQLRPEHWGPPLRPIGSVSCRCRFSASTLLVDAYSRSPSRLGLLPAEKPLVAANSSDRDACRELDGLLGIVCGQQVGQAPTGLGVSSLIFGEVGPVRDLALIESHA